MACCSGCWRFRWTSDHAPDLPKGRPNTRIFWRAAYLLIAAASVASYFISYRHPPLSPPVVSPIAQLPAFVGFVVVWIGSLFSVSAPAICGSVVLLFFVGLTIAAVRQMRRTGAWQPHYPWLVLACYTLASSCVAAVARLGFDHSMAGDSRYTAFSAFFYIALLGLGFSVCAQTKSALAHQANCISSCRRFSVARSHALGGHVQDGAALVAKRPPGSATHTAHGAMERCDSAES